MSFERKPKIFLYHAYALGAGGFVERQGEHLAIASAAPGALSIAGGRNFTTHGLWSWTPPFDPEPAKGGFRVSIGSTDISLWTEETEEAWITYGQVTLQEFNLCDRLKIGLMVGMLTSTHRKTFNESDGKPEAEIRFTGSKFLNVFVDNEPVDVAIDHTLDRFPTHRELKEVVAGTKGPTPDPTITDDECTRWKNEFRRRKLLEVDPTRAEIAPGDNDYVKDLADRKSNRITRCSIVSEVRKPEASLRHVESHGYSIAIKASPERKEFGRVFFGEMIVADGMKRLNMVRWNLGCENCSDGTAGTLDLNGDSMP